MKVRKTQKNKEQAINAAKNGEVTLVELGRRSISSAEKFQSVLESKNAILVKNEESGYWATYTPGCKYSVNTSSL